MTNRIPLINPPGPTAVALKRADSDAECVKTSTRLTGGDIAVSLEGEAHDVWVGLDAVNDLSRDLVRAEFDEEPPTPVGDADGVMYAHIFEKEDTCVACGDAISDTGVRFQTGNRFRGQWAWCHAECATDLATALVSVWEYADEFCHNRA